MPRRRERSTWELPPGYRLIQKVGNSFRARGWVEDPPFGEVNLGLYRGTEPGRDFLLDGARKAWQVVQEYERRWEKQGQCPVEAWLAMQQEGLIPAGVVPPGACEVEPGVWVARKRPAVKDLGVVTLRRRTYKTAADASRAMIVWVRKHLRHPEGR